ncbi:MAG: type IV pilus assembly protein PilM [Candidatus Magasanikbacteria bacterium]|nr:type IV pilus assembly protein PilM [Candidatus Magasanikbacteria bacterium]
MFTNPFPNAFGLDIGDLSVKLIQLRNRSLLYREPYYELVNIRNISLPPGLIVNGELQQPEEVRQRIAKMSRGMAAKQKPVRSPWVVAALPETQSFIKMIQIKKPLAELIDADILIAAKKHIPFDEDNYYLQWQIIPNGGGQSTTNVLIGATPKLIADSYTYLLESLGLGVIALEIEALAITRSMITAKKAYLDEARVILDIGASRSCLIVHDHGIIQFSTSLPFSGEIITTAIAQALHLTNEEAEAIKLEQGLNFKQNRRNSWTALVKLTDDFVDSIKNAIDFYYSHFPEANRITRIVMCGGGSNLKRLDRIISAKLKITARPGNPWKNLSATKDIGLSPEKAISYATAIGLGLRAADNPFFTKYLI